MKKLARSLIDNSLEAFILSLEIVNKLSIKYRVQTFCFLFCNAWELLLKAKLLSEGRKIFYPKERKKPRRSLSLDDCLSRTFTAINDPIKRNIEKIQELRNNAAHLCISHIPPEVMGLFQAGILNYTAKLREWFGLDIASRVPVGMMSLVFDPDPLTQSIDSPLVKRKMTPDVIKFLKSYVSSIDTEFKSLFPTKSFYIPIAFKLALVRNPNKADIVLSTGQGGERAIVFEVPKNPDQTHPHRTKDVVEQVNTRLSGKTRINNHSIYCVRKVHGVENRNEFFYKSKFASPQYSGAFIDWLIEQFERDNGFFQKAHEKAKALTKN